MCNDLKYKAREIKTICLQMCIDAGIGHVTTAMSCAEIVTALYYEIMNINPQKPDWADRDRFIMSKNHGSVIVYPILADLGFINKSELSTFMKDGSRLGGHSKLGVNGIDFSGGSLGMGLGTGCGIAYGAKLNNQNYKTYVLVGDGESYEGSIWESVMFASANKLDNLIAIVDRNRMACTDFTEKMLPLEPYVDKWKHFGWHTYEVNGHDIEEVVNALNEAKHYKGNSPVCIVANTEKGHGIDFMLNNPFMHGIAPKGENAEKAMRQIMDS